MCDKYLTRFLVKKIIGYWTDKSNNSHVPLFSSSLINATVVESRRHDVNLQLQKYIQTAIYDWTHLDSTNETTSEYTQRLSKKAHVFHWFSIIWCWRILIIIIKMPLLWHGPKKSNDECCIISYFLISVKLVFNC